VSGPAIERWGEIRTLVGPGVGDGLVILAVDTSDLGGGVWRYEYALHNRDSHRAVRGITIPVGAGTAITNVGFHDSDFDPANDWIVTLEDGRLSWSTGEYGSAGANPLDYGLLYNVRFDAALAPENTTATLETFRPGAGAATYGCPTRGPAVATSVIPTGDHDRAGTLGTCHPMPATSEVRIPFAISRPTMVSLAVFGSDGRRVRDLAAREFPAGNHEIMWRGDGDDGRDVAPGVYYLRFETGGALDFRSVVIAR
jgi:hypothetical protein